MGAESVTKTPSRGRQALSLLLRVAISGALLYLLWRSPKVRRACGQLSPGTLWWLLGAVVLYAGCQVVNAVKWQVLLDAMGHAVPLRDLLRMTFAGMFANLFLPTAVGGDVARIGLLGAYQVPLSLATLSVFTQRLTGFVALLVIGLAGLLCTGRLGDPVPRGVFVGLSVLLAAIVVAAVVGWWLDRRLDVSDKLPAALGRPLRKLGAGTRALLRSPRALGYVMLLSFVFQLWQVGIGAVLAWPAHCGRALVDYFWLVPVTAVGGMVPVGLGGIGAREHTANLVMGDAGVVWQVLWDAMVVLSSLPGGLLLLAGVGGGGAKADEPRECAPRAEDATSSTE